MSSLDGPTLASNKWACSPVIDQKCRISPYIITAISKSIYNLVLENVRQRNAQNKEIPLD